MFPGKLKAKTTTSNYHRSHPSTSHFFLIITSPGVDVKLFWKFAFWYGSLFPTSPGLFIATIKPISFPTSMMSWNPGDLITTLSHWRGFDGCLRPGRNLFIIDHFGLPLRYWNKSFPTKDNRVKGIRWRQCKLVYSLSFQGLYGKEEREKMGVHMLVRLTFTYMF